MLGDTVIGHGPPDVIELGLRHAPTVVRGGKLLVGIWIRPAYLDFGSVCVPTGGNEFDNGRPGTGDDGTRPAFKKAVFI